MWLFTDTLMRLTGNRKQITKTHRPGDQNPYSMTATAKISALMEMSKEMGRSPAEKG